MLLQHRAEGVYHSRHHGLTSLPEVLLYVSSVHQERRDQVIVLVVLLCGAASLLSGCLWLLEHVST